jgi:hypothetical protein
MKYKSNNMREGADEVDAHTRRKPEHYIIPQLCSVRCPFVLPY